MRNPLLTISIPTYNRADCIQRMVRTILPQMTDEIALIVIDNQSPYDIFSLFTEEEKKKFDLRRNDVNIGGDANIARCFEVARTKWVWVLGDDDMIYSDSVSRVLRVIKEYPDYAYIKFNSIFIGETVGIQGFCEAMKTKLQFAHSFFISESVHNLDKTRDTMMAHYLYLSLAVGQILRVIHYLLNSDGEKCVFLKDKIIEDQGLDLGWNGLYLIPRHLMMFDMLRKYRKVFRDSIFREIAAFCLHTTGELDIPCKEKWYYYRQVFIRYGTYNTIRYNYRNIISLFFMHLIGKNNYRKIRLRMSDKYLDGSIHKK